MSKLINVIGSSGSGKSLVSLALATKLKNTLIVSFDLANSTLLQYIPTDKDGLSITEVLSLDVLSQSSFKNKLTLYNNDVAILGTNVKDTPISNNINFTKTKVEMFVNALQGLGFDYIIYDTKTDISADPIGLYLLDKTDCTIRTQTLDIKGFEHLNTIKNWVAGINYNDHISILSPCFSDDTSSYKADYSLPFSLEVLNKFSAGDILSKYVTTDGQLFGKEIERLYSEVKDELHR